MSRNTDNLRQITTFLMMNNSSPLKGYTAKEISEAVPSLKERTVYRLLSTHPQFNQTENSIHPIRWWFDPLQVKIVSETIDNSMAIRPEFKVTASTHTNWIGRLLRATVGDENALAEQAKLLGKAANNAVLFQQNKADLSPEAWANAKQALDQLERFTATLYQRIQSMKNDERFDTPEWWAIFDPEEN